MYDCYLHFYDIEKEEKFLNKKAKNGWLLSRKKGPFYKFEKKLDKPFQHYIDVATADTDIVSNDFLHTICEKPLKKDNIKTVYSFSDNTEFIGQSIEKDNWIILRYYLALKRQSLSIFNMLVYSLFIGIIAVTFMFPEFLDHFPFVFLLYIGICAIAGFAFYSVSKLVTTSQLKSGNFSDQFTVRYIVVLPSNVPERLQNLSINMDYLGHWNHAFTKNDLAYYYLYSNTREDRIKSDLLDYLNVSQEDVFIIHPMYLFPL